METIRARGLDVAYERTGTGPASTGPTLVLAHGAGDDHRVWRSQRDALADACTVVAWDEPGSGRSSDLPAGFGLAEYADCLAELIQAVGGPAIVGGISWGGTVALELWRRHPASVRALILADTYAGWKGSLPAREVDARVAAAAGLLAAPLAALPLAATPLADRLFAHDPPAEHVALLRELAASARPATLRAQVTIMAATDLRDVLPGVAVPTLLVWGDRDARSPLRVAREFERTIPGASLVVLPDCGHLSNLERPESFNRAVLAFCRALGA